MVMALRMIREGSRLLLSKDDVGDSAKFILCVKRKPLCLTMLKVSQLVLTRVIVVTNSLSG